MVDRYHVGSIKRLNPESHRSPLLSVNRTIDLPGGAGNVAENLEAMGAEVRLVSQASGKIVKSRLVDDDGVVARFDVDEVLEPLLIPELIGAAQGCCAVLVSDYGKGSIDRSVVDHVRLLELPTFVDCKVRPENWSGWVDGMFPNYAEFYNHKDAYSTAKLCVIKRGEGGASAYGLGIHIASVRSFAGKVKNVAGAGDTAFASFVASYCALFDVEGRDRVSRSLDISMRFAASAVAHSLTFAPVWNDAYPLDAPMDRSVAQIVAKRLISR